MDPHTRLNTHAELAAAIESLRLTQQRLMTATEALRKSEEHAITGRLALEVMHEVRGPIDALGNLTHLTFAEADDPEKVRTYMILAEEQMKHLCHIARQTLGFAQQTEKPKSVDFVDLAEAAIRIHRHAIDEKRIRLIRDLPDSIVAEVHPGEILQVVSNLIVNALDALPENGVLRLRLRMRHGEVHFVIADNGYGIPSGHTESIFQPFFTTKAERGTGLGLSLSKRIIEHHQGRIRVRSSVRPGKSGTAFRVSLPIR